MPSSNGPVTDPELLTDLRPAHVMEVPIGKNHLSLVPDNQ